MCQHWIKINVLLFLFCQIATAVYVSGMPPPSTLKITSKVRLQLFYFTNQLKKQVNAMYVCIDFKPEVTEFIEEKKTVYYRKD